MLKKKKKKKKNLGKSSTKSLSPYGCGFFSYLSSFSISTSIGEWESEQKSGRGHDKCHCWVGEKDRGKIPIEFCQLPNLTHLLLATLRSQTIIHVR